MLYASNNNIPSFDLGNNPLMRTIHIAGNPVKELDVTRFPYIRSLDISNTSISRVMLMQASYLESFRAANTLIEFIDFNGQQAQRNQDEQFFPHEDSFLLCQRLAMR